ncbi:MAG: lysylphosphatidylglycerol synthase domain-containing protein [Gemmatimonadota bacterium]
MSGSNRGRHAWRVLQALAALIILFFLIRDVGANWEKIRAADLAWHIRPLFLAGGVVITWGMYAMLIWTWRRFLHDWGGRLSFRTAARIWSVSSLGKYIPGKIWAIAGMALMSQRAGVAPWAATASAILLQGLAVGSGVVVVALADTSALEAQHPLLRPILGLLAVGSAVGVALLVSPALSSMLLRRFMKSSAIGAPRPVTIVVGIVANLLAWIGYGVAFWLMILGTLPEARIPLGVAIGSFTASYLAGLLFLLAPGGLGVREGAMYLMLQGTIGPAAAAALAIASRLMLTLTELGVAIPFLVFPGENTRVPT